ncbi:MAG: HAMP domain-containing sensor histidine kinase [Balneolaceae bacterium]
MSVKSNRIYALSSFSIVITFLTGYLIFQEIEQQNYLYAFLFFIAASTVIATMTIRQRQKTNRELINQLNKANSVLFKARENQIMQNHYLGIVSHDMRNALHVILSCNELLKSDTSNLTDDQQEFISHIGQSSDHLTELTKDILDIQINDEGKLSMNIQEYRIHKILDELVQWYNQIAEKKNIRVILNDELRDQTFNTDKLIFMQVADNLISNAVKYSPHGSKVSVFLEHKNHRLLLSVQDEGPGIKQEELKYLFDRYTRLSNQPTGGEFSTGLGLSIVKERIETLGGTIKCNSERGKGSTFIAEFPLNLKNNKD